MNQGPLSSDLAAWNNFSMRSLYQRSTRDSVLVHFSPPKVRWIAINILICTSNLFHYYRFPMFLASGISLFWDRRCIFLGILKLPLYIGGYHLPKFAITDISAVLLLLLDTLCSRESKRIPHIGIIWGLMDPEALVMPCLLCTHRSNRRPSSLFVTI